MPWVQIYDSWQALQAESLVPLPGFWKLLDVPELGRVELALGSLNFLGISLSNPWARTALKVGRWSLNIAESGQWLLWLLIEVWSGELKIVKPGRGPRRLGGFGSRLKLRKKEEEAD